MLETELEKYMRKERQEEMTMYKISDLHLNNSVIGGSRISQEGPPLQRHECQRIIWSFLLP